MYVVQETVIQRQNKLLGFGIRYLFGIRYWDLAFLSHDDDHAEEMTYSNVKFTVTNQPRNSQESAFQESQFCFTLRNVVVM